MSDCKDCPDTQIVFGKNRTVKTTHPLFWIFCRDELGSPSFGELSFSIPRGYERIEIDPRGQVEYKKDLDDWESPRSIDGFERDPKNPNVFRPLWVPCRSRMYSIIVKDGCQCIDVLVQCIHNKPGEDGPQYVKYEDCEKCTYLRSYRNPLPRKKTINDLRVPNLHHSST